MADLRPLTRGPELLLLCFCVCLLFGGMPLVDSHSAPGVDVRTYIEMAAGVAQHGLPYLDNGPVDRFPGLEVPFGVAERGHLWGMYGPVYAYYAAPFLKLGGLVLVSRATFVLLIPIAFITYVLARQILDDRSLSTAAGILTVAATPLLSKGWAPTGYLLVVLFALCSTTLSVVAVSRERTGTALAAGVCAGLGAGTHLLCVPIAMGNVAALLAVDAAGDVVKPTLLPTKRKIARAGRFILGFSLCCLPLAALNSWRFRTLNPFSYGPHRWKWGGFPSDTMAKQIAFAGPILLLIGVVACVLIFGAKRWPRARFAAFIPAAAIIWSSPRLSEDLLMMCRVAVALVFDMGVLKLPLYQSAPGTFGAMRNGAIVKSVVQSLPFVPLILMSLRTSSNYQTQVKRLCVALPCVMLFIYLLSRGSLGPAMALGYPVASMRYALPAIPMLVVLAMAGAGRAILQPTHAFVTVLLALICGIALSWDAPGDWPDDRLVSRHIIIVCAPFVFGLLALAGSWWSRARDFENDMWRRRIFTWLLVPPFALAIAFAFNHDLRLEAVLQHGCNKRLDHIAERTPQRFAIVGDLGPLDVVLPLRTTRDIEYTEMHQWTSPSEMRPLLTHWFESGRPIFVISNERPLQNPWSDLVLRSIPDTEGLYELRQN